MNHIDFFTNLDEFETLLRSRSEGNVLLLADKMDIDAFDLSMALCNLHKYDNEIWIEKLCNYFIINREDMLTHLMEVWLEVGDDVNESPLISPTTLRF